MTPAEAQVLLSMAAAYDNRRPDADAAKAWAAVLNDLRFDDCRLALIEHYRNGTDWLMPAMIRTAVRRIRAKRLHDHPLPAPPPDLTPLQTLQWQKWAQGQVADGVQLEDDARGELESRHLPELRALIQRGPMPPEPEPLPAIEDRNPAAVAAREQLAPTTEPTTTSEEVTA